MDDSRWEILRKTDQSEEGGTQHSLTCSFQFMCQWNWLPGLDLLIWTFTPTLAVTSIGWILAHSDKAPDMSFLQRLCHYGQPTTKLPGILSAWQLPRDSPQSFPAEVKGQECSLHSTCQPQISVGTKTSLPPPLLEKARVHYLKSPPSGTLED